MSSEFNPIGRPCVVFGESNDGVSEHVEYQGEAVGFLDGHLGIHGSSENDSSITTIEWFPKAWVISGRIKFYYGFNNLHLQIKQSPTKVGSKPAILAMLPQNSNSEFELEQLSKEKPEISDPKNDEDDGDESHRKSSVTVLKVGEKIPEFKLLSTDGNLFSTSEISKKTVLYFYPADGTESCTIQAKGFSAVYSSIIDMGLDIIGVSPDTIESHNKFRKEEGIPFHLLFDDASKVCDAFGLMQSPPPYEKYPMRVTFLIGADRKILGVWNDIDVSTHSEDVVSFVLEVLDKAG